MVQKKAAKKAAPKAAAAPAEKPAATSETKKAPAAKAAASNDDLKSKTVAELKELAKAKGISGISSMKKADLIAALNK